MGSRVFYVVVAQTKTFRHVVDVDKVKVAQLALTVRPRCSRQGCLS